MLYTAGRGRKGISGHENKMCKTQSFEKIREKSLWVGAWDCGGKGKEMELEQCVGVTS